MCMSMYFYEFVEGYIIMHNNTTTITIIYMYDRACAVTYTLHGNTTCVQCHTIMTVSYVYIQVWSLHKYACTVSNNTLLNYNQYSCMFYNYVAVAIDYAYRISCISSALCLIRFVYISVLNLL